MTKFEPKRWFLLRPDSTRADRFAAFYWGAQRRAVSWVALVAALGTVVLAYSQYRDLAPEIQLQITLARLCVLTPSMLLVGLLSHFCDFRLWVRDAVFCLLLVIGISQVFIHGWMKSAGQLHLVPFTSFVLCMAFFYLLSCVGIRRAAIVCVGTSTAYCLMEWRILGAFQIEHIRTLVLANAAGFAAAFIFEQLLTELFHAEEAARRAASEDSLTGLPNRRASMSGLETALALAQREQRQLSVAMIDLDYFKRLNDQLGHLAGDQALCHVALLMRDLVGRPLDVVGRWGGEEFLLVYFDAKPAAAHHRLMQFCRQVYALQLPNPAAPLGVVTVSLGVWTGVPSVDDSTDDLIAHADFALYEAKAAGRNRMAVSAATTYSE